MGSPKFIHLSAMINLRKLCFKLLDFSANMIDLKHSHSAVEFDSNNLVRINLIWPFPI